MKALLVAPVVLAFIFGGALLGLALRARLPDRHLSDDSKDIVKLSIGVVATMAALVLGLLVSSAKGSFDRTEDELTLTASKVVQLDRALLRYGPEATGIRGGLRRNYGIAVDALTSQGASRLAQLQTRVAGSHLEDLVSEIRKLSPASDTQREIRARALMLAEDLNANRWLLLLQQHDSISSRCWSSSCSG